MHEALWMGGVGGVEDTGALGEAFSDEDSGGGQRDMVPNTLTYPAGSPNRRNADRGRPTRARAVDCEPGATWTGSVRR